MNTTTNKTIIAIIGILLINLFIWYIFLYTPKIKICETDIRISKQYYKFIEKENQLNAICFYQDRILNYDEYKYLDSIYNTIGTAQKFFSENTEYYIEVMIKSDTDKFIEYFDGLDAKEKFKIHSILRLSKNQKSKPLLKKLENLNK